MGFVLIENDIFIAEEILNCFSDKFTDIKVSVTNESIDVDFSLKDDNLERNILLDDEMARRIGKIVRKYSSVSSTISFSSYLKNDFNYQIKFKSPTPLISSFSTVNSSRHKYFFQLFCRQMDEEGQGYLSDLRSEWRKMNLTKNQIQRRELIFISQYYWGVFMSWIISSIFLSPTKIK
jgi:hypothetical protein